MKAINYILWCGAFSAAVAAALFCARVGHFGLACGDVRVAAAGWLGMIWFGAAAIKIASWVCRQERDAHERCSSNRRGEP